MTQEELQIKSIELRRNIHNVMAEFWKQNPEFSLHETFFLNSIVSSSLIAQIIYSMFKKDIGYEQQFAYIDEICKITKDQIEKGAILDLIGSAKHEH